MSLTLIVTRDVEDRYRGFLSSVMFEVSPGVYVAPRMSAGVRDRVWRVVTGWWEALGNGSLTLVWREATAPGGLRIETLGEPPRDIQDADGVLLVSRKRTTRDATDAL